MSAPAKPGRPKAEEPGSSVCTWLPSRDHDRLIAVAREREQSVSAVVRTVITAALSRRNFPTKQ